MKKTLLTLTACLFLSASWALAQTASFAFDDLGAGGGTATTGTYNTSDVFSVNVNLTFAGGTSPGYSLWLETETGVAGNITITGETYFVFTIATDGEAKPWNFTDVSGRQSTSFLTDQSATQAGDLGATASSLQNAGTYTVSTIQFTLSGAAPGTYHLETTTASPKVSEATVAGNDAFAAQTIYTFTVSAIPEPATWSLLALGGLGAVGMNLLRARRKS